MSSADGAAIVLFFGTLLLLGAAGVLTSIGAIGWAACILFFGGAS